MKKTLVAATTTALMATGAISAPAAAAPSQARATTASTPTAATQTSSSSSERRNPGFGRGVDVASWNVLGHHHTAPGGRKHRKGWASGTTRMRLAVNLLNKRGYDIVGLQELQRPQRAKLRSYAKRWSFYAGGRDNAVAWRTSQFRLVTARNISIPYFRGKGKKMPYVLLEQRSTGQRLWVASFHNPADARGPAQKHRNRAAQRQIDLAKRLGRTGVPVVFTGDFNESWSYVCKLHRRTDMRSFVGGGVRNGKCVTSKRWNRVDWVLGNRRVKFSRASMIKDRRVRRVTDHPLVGARVTLRR